MEIQMTAEDERVIMAMSPIISREAYIAERRKELAEAESRNRSRSRKVEIREPLLATLVADATGKGAIGTDEAAQSYARRMAAASPAAFQRWSQLEAERGGGK